MPESYFNIEWLNQNSQRKYPLNENATGIDLTGAFTLPDSLILELYLPIHSGLQVIPEFFFLSLITITSNGVMLGIGYDDSAANYPLVAVAQFNRSTHFENASYALVGQGDLHDVFGTITIGVLDELNLQPAGTYRFDRNGGLLDTDCIRPMVQGVSSITISNGGGDQSAPITGDVTFIAGANIQFAISPGTGGGSLRIDAIDTSGFSTVDPCAADVSPPPPIRTINMIPADANGDFTLQAGDCVSITKLTNGLKLEDNCSQPCCGCVELDAVMAQLQHLANEVPSLRGLVNKLNSEITNMAQVVLSARLGDTGACP
jgi:hypothetical protein